MLPKGFGVTYEGLKLRIEQGFQIVLYGFGVTYEGLKRITTVSADKTSFRGFGVTYEGLKL